MPEISDTAREGKYGPLLSTCTFLEKKIEIELNF